MAEGETQVVKPKVVFDNYDTVIGKVTKAMDDLIVYEFYLVGKTTNFVAGQYFSLMVPGVGPAPFSIASSPEIHDMIELAIEITGGKHTGWIAQLKPGDHAILRGPFGTFVMQPTEKKVCYLAGGVGITPFMSMLRWIRDTHKDDIQATLFYSCKVKDQFLWMKELEEMHNTHPNIRVIFTLTREDPPGWKYEKGRINADMIRNYLPDFAEHTFYSCGPPALIQALFDMLRGMGIPDERLKQEKW